MSIDFESYMTQQPFFFFTSYSFSLNPFSIASIAYLILLYQTHPNSRTQPAHQFKIILSNYLIAQLYYSPKAVYYGGAKENGNFVVLSSFSRCSIKFICSTILTNPLQTKLYLSSRSQKKKLK